MHMQTDTSAAVCVCWGCASATTSRAERGVALCRQAVVLSVDKLTDCSRKNRTKTDKSRKWGTSTQNKTAKVACYMARRE